MSDDFNSLSASERHAMIAVAAYYLAEQRGFASGHAEADWLLAERTIDAMIAQRQLTTRTDAITRGRLIRNALVLAESGVG